MTALHAYMLCDQQAIACVDIPYLSWITDLRCPELQAAATNAKDNKAASAEAAKKASEQVGELL